MLILAVLVWGSRVAVIVMARPEQVVAVEVADLWQGLLKGQSSAEDRLHWVAGEVPSFGNPRNLGSPEGTGFAVLEFQFDARGPGR